MSIVCDIGRHQWRNGLVFLFRKCIICKKRQRGIKDFKSGVIYWQDTP